MFEVIKKGYNRNGLEVELRYYRDTLEYAIWVGDGYGTITHKRYNSEFAYQEFTRLTTVASTHDIV